MLADIPATGRPRGRRLEDVVRDALDAPRERVTVLDLVADPEVHRRLVASIDPSFGPDAGMEAVQHLCASPKRNVVLDISQPPRVISTFLQRLVRQAARGSGQSRGQQCGRRSHSRGVSAYREAISRGHQPDEARRIARDAEYGIALAATPGEINRQLDRHQRADDDLVDAEQAADMLAALDTAALPNHVSVPQLRKLGHIAVWLHSLDEWHGVLTSIAALAGASTISDEAGRSAVRSAFVKLAVAWHTYVPVVKPATSPIVLADRLVKAMVARGTIIVRQELKPGRTGAATTAELLQANVGRLAQAWLDDVSTTDLSERALLTALVKPFRAAKTPIGEIEVVLAVVAAAASPADAWLAATRRLTLPSYASAS